MMKPLFKWTGGKNKMFGHYAPYFYPKDDFETFVDAFCGAGAASIWIASRYPNVKFILNDFNGEMMLLYRQLAKDGDDFIRKAIVIQNKFKSYTEHEDKKSYYEELKYRHIDQMDDPMDEAVQLYVMLRVNFNGWWKIYNYSKGRYATPAGILDKTQIISVRDLKKWSNFLSTRCTLLNGDFDGVVEHIKDKSYVYFDPPYRDSTTVYTEDDFDEDDQIRLCELSEKLNQEGHYVGYSNKEIGDGFFQKHLPSFNHYFFDVNYSAGRGTSYNPASEILATNFQQGSVGLEEFFE